MQLSGAAFSLLCSLPSLSCGVPTLSLTEVSQGETLGLPRACTQQNSERAENLKVILDTTNNKLLYMMDNNAFGSVNDVL